MLRHTMNLFANSRMSARRSLARSRHTRPRLEPLEDRLVLSNGALSNLNLTGLLGNTQPVGSTGDVTQHAGNEFNPAIAIDPTHPSHLFEVSNWEGQTDAQGGFIGLLASSSSDGGAHWTTNVLAIGKDTLPIAYDAGWTAPSVAWDAYGNLFLAYCGPEPGNKGGIVVALSTDGGQTFTPLSLAISHPASYRPKISTGAGTVWVAFSNLDPNPGPSDPRGHPYMLPGPVEAAGARVTGLGQVGSFSTPQDVPNSTGGTADDIAVGPNGQVMVTFHTDQDWPYKDRHGPANIYTALDADGLGPAGFSAPQITVVTQVDTYHPILQSWENAVANPAPGLAWDLSSGPHRGRLYLVYTDASSGNDPATNIFVKYSDDNGAHWSGPIQANDDSGGNSHFLPRIAVDQSTGWVAVSWYDARNAAGNDEAEVFATVSVDAHGLSFLPNVQVAAGASFPMAINMFDDYYSTFGSNTGLAFYGGTFYPAWADNSTALTQNPDWPNFDIAVAAVQAPWSAGLPRVIRVDHGNPDPLAVRLASEIYVLLHTPDPAPLGVQQTGVITQTGVQQIRQGYVGSLAVDSLFARAGTNGTGGMGDYRAAGGGQQRAPLSLLSADLLFAALGTAV
jgi:hypothetical protein